MFYIFIIIYNFNRFYTNETDSADIFSNLTNSESVNKNQNLYNFIWEKNLIEEGPAKLDLSILDLKTYKEFLTNVFEFTCGKKVDVLIFVLSKPDNFLMRNTHRKTISKKDVNHTYFKFMDFKNEFSHCYIFVIGSSNNLEVNKMVNLESEKYHDIVRLPILESYYNLPKKVATSFYSFNFLKKRFDYIFKTDDDIVVKTRILIPVIYKLYEGCHVIGNFKKGAEVIRDKDDKYYMPESVYPNKTFVDYPEGTGYVIRSDSILRIIGHFNDVPYFPFEDVMMGEMLLKTNLKKGHYIRFKRCVDNGNHYCDHSLLIMVNSSLTEREKIIRFYEKDYT